MAGWRPWGATPSAEVCRLALGLAGLENEHGNSQAVRQVLETWQPVARAWRDQAAAEGTDEGVAAAEAIEANLLAQFIEDGQLLEDSGLALEAAELYAKAYELAPDRHEILPRLVGAYLAAGETMKARVTARLARDDHPDEAGGLAGVGQGVRGRAPRQGGSGGLPAGVRSGARDAGPADETGEPLHEVGPGGERGASTWPRPST